MHREVAQRMPESFRAFWRIVSFTAAKTSRIFDVSVACVRLVELAKILHDLMPFDLLGIEMEVSAIHLVESPEKVF